MITFRRAVREAIGLIIGIAGPSGGGKTLSALRLATGLSNGKPFAFIDTENGRARHYADRFTFDIAELGPPFRPSAYLDAITASEKAGYPVIVVDSCSHEHAGEGGLLDWHDEIVDRMAKGDEKRRESCNMAAWVEPKMAHKEFVNALLRTKAHIILCFRAEQKIEMVRGKDGRLEVQAKKILSGFTDWIPIAEKNLLYEMTASFIVTPDHPGVPTPIKLEESLRELLDLKKPLDERTGELLASWARGREGAAPVDRGASKSEAANISKEMDDESASLAPSSPADPYIAKLKTCANNEKAINAVYQSIPETIRQDCYRAYADRLRGIAKA